MNIATKSTKSQNKSGEENVCASCVFSWLKLFSMKPDDFEQMLRGQPARKVPADGAAKSSPQRRPLPAPDLMAGSQLSTLNSQLGCGHARSVGGSGGSLLLILAVNFCHARRITGVGQARSAALAGVILALREQKQLLAELVGRAK